MMAFGFATTIALLIAPAVVGGAGTTPAMACHGRSADEYPGDLQRLRVV
jgi:hypothetical protein